MAEPNNYFVDPVSGNDSTGDGSVGTPWKTTQKALDTITRDTTGGDTVNIKAGGTDTLSATLDLSTYGTPDATGPLFFRGYTSAAKDGGIGVISGDGSVGILIGAPVSIGFIDMHVHNSGSAEVLDLGAECVLFNTEVNDSTTQVMSLGPNCRVIHCHLHSAGTGGANYVLLGGPPLYLHKTVIESGVRAPQFLCVPGSGAIITHCIFNCAGATHGIGYKEFSVISNCSFYGGGSGTGEALKPGGGDKTNMIMLNNLIEGFGGVGGQGVGADAADLFAAYGHISFFDNTTDETNSPVGSYAGDGNESLASTLYVDADADDFDPNNVGNIFQGSFPASYLGMTDTKQIMDRGAAQDTTNATGTGSSGKYKGLINCGGLGSTP